MLLHKFVQSGVLAQFEEFIVASVRCISRICLGVRGGGADRDAIYNLCFI
jgi:hypothetical protein